MIDTIFNYATGHQINDLSGRSAKLQASARCRVRVSNNVAIATELPDNPGMSVTNAAGLLAMQVCQFYEIEPQKLIWIEHYPEAPDCSEESFDRVQFTFTLGALSDPRWKRISKDEAEQLLCSSGVTF